MYRDNINLFSYHNAASLIAKNPICKQFYNNIYSEDWFSYLQTQKDAMRFLENAEMQKNNAEHSWIKKSIYNAL